MYSSTGGILGKADFDYYDRDKKTLLRLVKDPKLQSEFVGHWADFWLIKRREVKDQIYRNLWQVRSCNYFETLLVRDHTVKLESFF